MIETEKDTPWNTVMKPLDFEELKTDREFKYFLKTLPNLHYYKLTVPLQNTKTLLERLLILIEEELKKLE